VRTWKETRPDDFAMLEMQDRVMMIILLVLFVLDGAFIMAILWVLVSDKTRDIGTVRALGAGRFGVVATFVLQGLAIGVLGTAVGMAGGLALAEHVNAAAEALDQGLRWVGLAPQFQGISRGLFGMHHLPVFYDPVHMVSIVLTTMAMSILASLAPAWRAARLDPVEALRHD
jgi:lipoprotein-releasing system permease protein